MCDGTVVSAGLYIYGRLLKVDRPYNLTYASISNALMVSCFWF